jgi:hypothetical protein
VDCIRHHSHQDESPAIAEHFADFGILNERSVQTMFDLL